MMVRAPARTIFCLSAPTGKNARLSKKRRRCPKQFARLFLNEEIYVIKFNWTLNDEVLIFCQSAIIADTVPLKTTNRSFGAVFVLAIIVQRIAAGQTGYRS